MIRSFIRYLKGYVKIRIQGFSPERFLNMCSYHEIYIWGLAPAGNGYEMYLSIADFRRLKPLARKTHSKSNWTGAAGFHSFFSLQEEKTVFFRTSYMYYPFKDIFFVHMGYPF